MEVGGVGDRVGHGRRLFPFEVEDPVGVGAVAGEGAADVLGAVPENAVEVGVAGEEAVAVSAAFNFFGVRAAVIGDTDKRR